MCILLNACTCSCPASPRHVSTILIPCHRFSSLSIGRSHPKNAHTISWRDAPSFLAMLNLWVTDADPWNIPVTISSSLHCTAQNCLLPREKCFQTIHNPARHFCISYTHFTFKEFFKMLSKELPFAKWEVWRSHVAAWDVFHHICLFPPRIEWQLLVVEELIQLTLAWLRAGADPKPYPKVLLLWRIKK